jgi:N-acyl amino acid synthase of PEP-CTERM/exosortase system
MDSLAKNFSQYFRVGIAATRQQQRYAYAIRHQVYAEELGWEPVNDHQLESDDCDCYSYHCLLEHKRSGEIAGCVRLVLPQIGSPESPLPCQMHQIPMKRNRHLSEFVGTQVGEISRLAVPSNYRRRKSEAGKPFILNEQSTTSIYDEEERRNFPNISIGLYLASIALVELCNLERVLVVMEPRLQRHLQRFGLVFHQISQTFELHGTRALFELPRDELTSNMEEGVLGLFKHILGDLDQQWDQMLQIHYDSALSNDCV